MADFPGRPARITSLRRGNVLVLSAFLIIIVLAMVSFSVDLGYLLVSSAELQRNADATALAAAWDLIDTSYSDPPDRTKVVAKARSDAATFVGRNFVCGKAPGIDSNASNAPNGDLVFGYLSSIKSPVPALDLNQLDKANAVQVRVRRSKDMNGEVPFFFARALGHKGVANQAQATAVVISDFQGFKAPAGGENLAMLPFALDVDTWNAMLKGKGADAWTRSWDDNSKKWTVKSGGDGVLEVNLFPQGTGSPGNRGTVDIGSSNNSTKDIARQITDGISSSDLDHVGGELKLDSHGKLNLNGDTGISAGVKDELASIRGQPRIIPIFEKVTGPGNNASYTIVKFVGVSILDVKLTGGLKDKAVMIQPASVVTGGGIPGTNSGTSQFIYSKPFLIH